VSSKPTEVKGQPYKRKNAPNTTTCLKNAKTEAILSVAKGTPLPSNSQTSSNPRSNKTPEAPLTKSLPQKPTELSIKGIRSQYRFSFAFFCLVAY